MDKNTDLNIMDKSMRSVFVGNIPYEATEEKLKDVFSEVGPVISLKLVFDRESGKPKGYGFCEYKDQETALSAMRNLNGYEIGGRTLRVDNACTEKSRMEMQQLLQGPQVENPYGDPVPSDKAPEVISKIVASLPPERLLLIMKQLTECHQQNPEETRNMLLKNPQISYAILQAQVVMKLIDPKDAVKFLYDPNATPKVLQRSDIPEQQEHSLPPLMSNPMYMQQTVQDVDFRNLDNRRGAGFDPRMSRGGFDGGSGNFAMNRPPQQIIGAGSSPINTFSSQRPGMPTNIPPPNRAMPPPVRGVDPPRIIDPRSTRPPLGALSPTQPSGVSSASQQAGGTSAAGQAAAVAAGLGGLGGLSLPNLMAAGVGPGASDQEKAELIMQVLQLSDEQIGMLPPEQRTSILVLKDQIAKSTQR